MEGGQPKALKFKVVMGSGPSETIKRLSKTPEDYEDLYDMILRRLSDRLSGVGQFFIYYEDISNGMIRIEDNTDLRGALDYCALYNKASLKLYIHLEQLDATISRVRTDYDNIDPDMLNEDDEDNDEDSYADSDPVNDGKSALASEVVEDKYPQNYVEGERENSKNLDDLIKNADSNDEAESQEEGSDDSEDIDYENHNPSFLQPMEEEEEPKHKDQERLPSGIGIGNPVNEVSENKPELGQNLGEVEQVQELFEEMNLNQEEHPQAQVNVEDHPLAFNHQEEAEKKEEPFQEVPIQPDQNVIMVNNQNFENNVMNKEEEEEDLVSLMINRKSEEEKEEAKEPRFRVDLYNVNKPVFAKKLVSLAGNQLPKSTVFSQFANSLKASIVGMSEEEADQLMRIDESHTELSNQDVILAKPGCVVKKCWRLKNLGSRQWPKDTRIVSVTDGLLHYPPVINEFLKPGEMMEIGVNVYIPRSEIGENNIKEYIMRLYSDELKCFGEPIIVTCHIDTVLFDESQFNLGIEDIECPRVSSEGSFVENYEIAKELFIKRGEPYAKTVYDLQKAEIYKNSY